MFAHPPQKNTRRMIEGPMAEPVHFLGAAPFLAMVIGAKCSGKSELVRYITYCYAKSFAYVVCISPTSLNPLVPETTDLSVK